MSGADCRHQHRVYSLSPSTATMAAAGSSAPHTAPHSPAPPPGYSVTLRPRFVTFGGQPPSVHMFTYEHVTSASRYRVRPRLVCGSEASSAEATHAGLASVRLEVRALGHWRLEHAARTRREAARARVSSLMVTIV